ncbi:MAG: hypothetical protein EOM02_06130 [Synergistales bacterium]|nr:hypothetical protein [Synergistales bacterium]
MSHTPGPWEVRRGIKQWTVDYLACGKFKRNIAHVWDDEDARLIAAAPDMKDEIDRLKAEKADMLAMLEEFRECAYFSWAWCDYGFPVGIVERTDEVIKKARGEE